MKKEFYGNLSTGERIDIVTLESENCTLSVINYGASIVSFKPFGIDIIGGFNNMEEYEADTSNQGAAVGRVANRIANARFTMDGAIYMLPANNNGHCLHGGKGFNRRAWNFEETTENSVTLSYYSEDGEEGFPNALLVRVRYTLEDATLLLTYEAIPEGKTPIALTNHSYFNLDGFGGDVLDHRLTIYADRYSEIDETILPTGERPLVYGTRFDFTAPTRIGDGISDGFKGYDHNFILSPKVFEKIDGRTLGLAAELENDSLKLSIFTDQPGIQLYTGNGLSAKNPYFKGGVEPIKYGGVCLETQTEPNATKRGEGFYGAGETYTHTCVYRLERKDSL